MSKERLYIADSGVDPSPLTPAQEAFFQWKYAVGTYEYASRHGRGARLEPLADDLVERYETYRTLRDGRPR